MVNTRSGLSTDLSSENSTPLEVLYIVTLLTGLYKETHIVTKVYQKFEALPNEHKSDFIKDLQEQYDILELARTIF